VLAALFGRERSGEGESLEVSLLETALHLQAATWCEYLGGAPEPTRIGHGQPHNAPAADVVATRDGHIVLSAYAEEHWQRFCRAMGREELITDPRFATNADRKTVWNGLTYGPEPGTYRAKIMFITAGEWAMGFRFRQDSTQALQRTEDWRQQVRNEVVDGQ